MIWIYGSIWVCGAILLAFFARQNCKTHQPESRKVIKQVEPPDYLGEALRQRTSRQRIVSPERERH